MRKLGIIDIGSNTARLLLVSINKEGSYKVFNQLKESIRLGQDMGDEQLLKPRRVYQTIQTLQMFKRLCSANNVDEIIAVATAAVRRAANQRSFLDEVYASTGIELKVLSG
ncbi:MAG TPA: Ppx/GppA family phosphatase, partial [Clostridia bacterium]|nr:Ppx/GppA family phosphatase [Clostridia bacterium]